jgi:ankyrin repeat protein
MLDVEYVSKVQSQSTINDWLGVTKLNDQHNVTQYYDKQTSSRLEGTCNWIFSHRSYESWISEDNPNETARILWICAPAGYGKTVLCARLVEHLKAMHSFPVAYFFASPHAQSGGEPSFILRSWIAQIAQLDSDVLEFVQEHLDAGQRASESSVWSIFATIVSANRNYTFVLDGFDEYSREDNIRATFLHKLKDVTGGTLSRILIASRKETDIEAELSPGKAEVAEYVLLQCKITKTDIWSDISLFSKCVVDEKLPKKDDRLRQDLAGQLAEKCEGMFLWIRLQKDQLRGSKNTKQLQNIVKDMPIGLIKTYERNWKTLQNHSPADRDRAFAILRWATFALRPLTVSEITEALIVRSDNDGTTPQWDELPDNIDDEYINSEIIDICGGLVETRAEKPGSEARFRTIHLIHPSVREFLLPTLSPSSMDISQPYAERSQAPSQAEQHEYLTTICLGYLKCDETWGKYALNKDSEHKDGFIDYAAVNWNKHMLLAGKENAMPLRLLEEFFHPENKSFKQWRMYIEPPFGKANAAQGKIEPLATPLYYAALFDLTSSMEHIRDRDPSQLNRVGGEFGTPLQAACFKGNESAFRLLCDWGADPNVQGGRFKVPINAAIAGGQTSMAEALIRMDVDHTLQDSYGRSPVFLAANNGSTKIVKQLIEKGANIAVPSLYGWTPLSSAADRGQVEVAKLLLEKGADIEVRSQDGWTPLNLATSSGHLEVVQLLFEKGADIATSTNTGSTPLITAADRGHLEVIKLLLEKGADVTVTNLNGWTPLNAAARNGHTEVVKLLLEKCANVDVTNYQNWTPLNCAACGGYIEAVKLLLEKGSDVATVNKDGWTPLNSAANSGHLEVVKILLEHGADVTIANNEGGTPLNTAANGGYVEVVKLLLENGADISVPNKNGWTPLNSAAGKGYIEIVKLLLQNGADVAAANNDSWTPLNSAADRGYVKIVKPPLEKGDDLSTAKNHGWTPLNSAANNGHIEVIKQLLEHGADMNRVGIHGWTPLNTAATNGHVEVVKLLLEKGADTTIANEDGWTPLNAAANNGHFETVKVLLEQGADSALAENDWTPLNTAATNGHVKIVKLLLENGADVNLANKEGWTPLEFAAFSGYSEIAKLLIEKEANTSISESGWMALSLAANYGHIEVIKLLLENGPDLAAVGKSGWTSLNAAANNDHVEATKLLLEHGAYAALNGLDPHFGTIFNLFAFKGYTDLLPFCYEKRNSPVLYPNDNHGRSPIHLAVRGGHIGTFQHLIRLGLDPTAKDANGDGLLCYASSGGSLEVLNAVWDQDSQSTPESNSWSPLHWACRAGVPEVVEALIEKGIRADCVTVPEREGKWSPLSIAIFHGHENMLGKLSASHKSLLAVDDSAMKTPGERHGGYWCDRCLHVSKQLNNCKFVSHNAGNLWGTLSLPHM